MGNIKSFEEFLKEDRNSKVSKIKFQDDEYSIIDKTFLNLDLSKIPIKT